ncbi:MAG: 2'-5' RNA ligase family protein [candidate division WOR-3 bacterium]|nr:MAG: 2'-5' RNA ligase family protein [candidate division WOR-3 bacterium]
MKADRKKELYSLWLMPAGEIADRLQAMIIRFSHEHSTPKFKPHVTLIGELNIREATAIARTRELASQIEPFIITLGEVTHLNRYFRCVFIKAEKTPELMNAHSIARGVFGQKDVEIYLPHLSLVYGDLNFRARQSVIRCTGHTMKIEFSVREIFLYYTGGIPRDWHCVSRMPNGRSIR